MIKQPKLSSFYGPNAEVYSAQDYEALAARLAEVEKDAERYRWLKSLSARSLSCGVEILDAAIDEAMRGSP